MKKGQVMSVVSRQKIKETKGKRIKRGRIGCKVVSLLLLNKVKQAKALANVHSDLFFIE